VAGESQRRIQGCRLAVNPGVDRGRAIYLQPRRAPSPVRNARVVTRGIEDDDPELAAGHPDRVCASRRRFARQRGQILTRGEDDGLDPLSRARSASLTRAALPSPDLRLMNSTGRPGGSAGRQP
jgi:hypothetical protein